MMPLGHTRTSSERSRLECVARCAFDREDNCRSASMKSESSSVDCVLSTVQDYCLIYTTTAPSYGYYLSQWDIKQFNHGQPGDPQASCIELEFSPHRIDDYFILKPTRVMPLSNFTLCVWMKPDTTATEIYRYTLFTYHTPLVGNAINIQLRPTDKEKIYFQVGGDDHRFFADGDLPLFDGRWHYLCMVWSNAGGQLEFYVNSIRVPGYMDTSDGITVGEGSVIPAGGVFVIGQYPDSYDEREGVDFDGRERYSGSLTGVNLYDYALSESDISNLYRYCYTYGGNVFSWSEVHQGITYGEVIKTVDELTCKSVT